MDLHSDVCVCWMDDSEVILELTERLNSFGFG